MKKYRIKLEDDGISWPTLHCLARYDVLIINPSQNVVRVTTSKIGAPLLDDCNEATAGYAPDGQ